MDNQRTLPSVSKKASHGRVSSNPTADVEGTGVWQKPSLTSNNLSTGTAYICKGFTKQPLFNYMQANSMLEQKSPDYTIAFCHRKIQSSASEFHTGVQNFQSDNIFSNSIYSP